MRHEELEISEKKYQIKASIKIPSNVDSKFGIILSHGGIINRQSLLRENSSFGEYLCRKLDAFVIAPDFEGETIHSTEPTFKNFSDIVNITTNYFVETYNLESIVGFGHSMGCFRLAGALPMNDYIDSIVNYGGPITELMKPKQKSYLNYLINYISNYKYKLDIKHLMKHIFDKETMNYLQEVMYKDDIYCSNNYNYNVNLSWYLELKELIDDYLDLIKNWNKPALLLYGTEDGVTKDTLSYYPDNYVDNNILFRHIQGASHITPCMDSNSQLSKLNIVVNYFNNIKNASLKTDSKSCAIFKTST